MIKYFGEILSKFNKPQRIIALFALIFLVLGVILGGKLLSALNYDDRELRNTVEFQRKEIETLRTELVKTNRLVLDNQRECTRNALQREQEIIKEIEGLENSFRNFHRRKTSMIVIAEDSLQPERRVASVVEEDNSPEIMLQGLKNLKKKVKSH